MKRKSSHRRSCHNAVHGVFYCCKRSVGRKSSLHKPPPIYGVLTLEQHIEKYLGDNPRLSR